MIEMRSHLFPCRTQKLSSSSPTILGGRLPGKIGFADLYAPLAQMVEQLTLNQWVLGSSPRWCTKAGPLVKWLSLRPLMAASPVRIWYGSPKRLTGLGKLGVDSKEVPPVPIPNTEVKLFSVEDTWLVTAWKVRTMPVQNSFDRLADFFC